jgi:hypothetical protein
MAVAVMGLDEMGFFFLNKKKKKKKDFVALMEDFVKDGLNRM